jgi:hypothetical protein
VFGEFIDYWIRIYERALYLNSMRKIRVLSKGAEFITREIVHLCLSQHRKRARRMSGLDIEFRGYQHSWSVYWEYDTILFLVGRERLIGDAVSVHVYKSSLGQIDSRRHWHEI